MAKTPEEARKKAYESTQKAGEEKVAAEWKRNFSNLALIYGLQVPPEGDVGDEEYRKMAKDLIDKRMFVAKREDNGQAVVIKIDDLDKNPELNDIRQSKGIKSFRDLIPSREQLNTMSDSVASGVEANTGTIGFLGGATIMNALSGLIKWMFSGFKGGFAGLKQSIADATTDSIRGSVKSNLGNLRAKRPDMAGMLTDDTITSISQQVQDGVKAEIKGEEQPKSGASLKDVKPETISDVELQNAKNTIKQAVLFPENDTPLKDKIAKEYVDGMASQGWVKQKWLSARGYSSEYEVNKNADIMANTIADSISKTATDKSLAPNLSRMSKEDYATFVADKAGEALLAKEKNGELSLAVKLGDTGKDGKTYLDTFKEQIKAQVIAKHEKLSVATRAANQVAVKEASERGPSAGASHEQSPSASDLGSFKPQLSNKGKAQDNSSGLSLQS